MDEYESVRLKVAAIFTELVGERAKILDGSTIAASTMDVIGAAYHEEYGFKTAADIGFHMSDWNSDAAFIVALHLFPEKFAPGEIEAGIRGFLIHAPSHIREASRLTNTNVWVDFTGKDEQS